MTFQVTASICGALRALASRPQFEAAVNSTRGGPPPDSRASNWIAPSSPPNAYCSHRLRNSALDPCSRTKGPFLPVRSGNNSSVRSEHSEIDRRVTRVVPRLLTTNFCLDHKVRKRSDPVHLRRSTVSQSTRKQPSLAAGLAAIRS
jgi:hypothetical protein